MKKLLILLLPLLLIGCKSKNYYDDSFEHFCNFYNDDYVSYYIETTTEHEVHELRTIAKTLAGRSVIKRDGYNLIYAKLDVLYLSNEKFYNLNWLVEYKYNDDYSYENATNYMELVK